MSLPDQIENESQLSELLARSNDDLIEFMASTDGDLKPEKISEA